MILNFYNKIKVVIDDVLVKDNYYARFIANSLDDSKPQFKLTIEAKNEINTNDCIDVSVYMKYNKEHIYLCDKNGRVCQSLFGKFDMADVTLLCEQGYDYSDLLSYVIKPFLRYKLIACDMALIHAGSFGLNNKNIVIAGWAHTGKTAMLLSALKRGAKFYGDDLSVVSGEGKLYPYTVPINLFYYNIKNNKSLRRHFRTSQIIKMNTARIIAGIFKFFQGLAKHAKMKYLFYAGKTFFEGSMHVAIFADQMFPESCNSVKGEIAKIILLERSQIISFTTTNQISLEMFAKRLQNCINYEFQRFNELITSAKWTPYYQGDKCFEKEEADIYINCFKNHNIYNKVIAEDQSFDILLRQLDV